MRLALRLHLIAHRLWSAGPVGRPFAKIVHWTSKALTNSDIDPRATLDRTVVIPHATGVVIGETTVIGARTTIMPGVIVGARTWDDPERHAKVGADVLLGAGAVLLGSVTIGDGAKVGANAVVLEDVAPGTSVVGVPARVVSGKAS